MLALCGMTILGMTVVMIWHAGMSWGLKMKLAGCFSQTTGYMHVVRSVLCCMECVLSSATVCMSDCNVPCIKQMSIECVRYDMQTCTSCLGAFT